MAKARDDVKRIQFDFTGPAFERLEKLKAETESASYAEVIRDALRVYEWYVSLEEKGLELARIKDGEIQAVVVLL